MATRGRNLVNIFIVLCYLFITPCYSKTDTLLQGQEISDGESLTSANGVFSLQFFKPRTSRDRYLGIGYVNSYTSDILSEHRVAWLANRNNPIPDASGKLLIDGDGNLKLSYSGDAIELSSVATRGNLSATLLDSGNFVLRELNSDGSVKKVFWQSFDYPADCMLPGMKIGIGFKTGHQRVLTSRVSSDFPAVGSFTLGVDPIGRNQLIVWNRGTVYWKSGPWLNGGFEFFPAAEHYKFSLVSNEEGIFFTFSGGENKALASYKLFQDGRIIEGDRLIFADCSRGGERGCVEEELPACKSNFDSVVVLGRGYVQSDGYKSNESYTMSFVDCRDKCMRSCSCFAFASLNANGTGCETWGQVPTTTQTNSSPLREIYGVRQQRKAKWRIWLITAIGGTIPVLLACCLCYLRWRKVLKERKAKHEILSELGVGPVPTNYSDKNKGSDFQVFSFQSIITATKNFSAEVKLGEGGFGPVYKGNLPDGRVIAIKRLSRSSGQGFVEFKTEIMLIAKLQHNNLVRLLGCCIEAAEKLLIYEYMPNKSLDFFLFNPSNENTIDWTNRFNIIEGIAQGLLYLHKYSRLRIIHRDLKASNILLDDDMNPKISDFGLARIFGRNESEANTDRVVGTYGYMSPEYAMEGIFSIKSDVFSFGVLLLEIVSGKRNSSSYHNENSLNLIGQAWELLTEGRGLELMDPALGNKYQSDEVLSCIHVGLLCVQDNPNDRPTMSEVVSMVRKETASLSRPKQPAFFIGRITPEAKNRESIPKHISICDVSISDVKPR
ncbi:hypothetical protein RHMOL_Rhmol08G0296300 [Rhododendron molle]|uniref:Uncharacterized protein n=1 Tax=Rhododendron molle TaxID=49168 RepID=A0ACC0MVX9_RHOML|nr:hypothetical protein RHMOL_Rhmol08G0296300 [Rhododendron molle]